jgi:hypothetical protein
MFISEVRLFQVVDLVQQAVVSGATGSGVLFEFPHATIQNGPSMEQFMLSLTKRQNTNDGGGGINLITSFLMNGTADISQKYDFPPRVLTLVSRRSNYFLRLQRR